MQSKIFTKNKNTATLLVGVFLLAVAVFVLSAPHVMAQASLGIEFGEGTGLGTTDIRTMVARIIQIVLGFLGLIAVALVIYGGYLWMTSSGNTEQIDKAKKLLINGFIGLIIILSSFAIVSFVIGRLNEMAYSDREGGDRGDGVFAVYGALGGGVLQNVFPEPGARDVPRNTLIMVTFKEAMDTTSIIEYDPDNYPNDRPDECQGVPDNTICGYLKTLAGNNENPTTKIINQTNNNAVLLADQVIAITNDHKNYVYKSIDSTTNPPNLIGNEDGYTDYMVNLTHYIDRAGGSPAFNSVLYTVGDLQITGYNWRFEVSNVLDVSPPQVESVTPVYPRDDEVAINTIVQINFSEAVNIITATGISDGNPDEGLTNILISYENNDGIQYMSGEATISNRFRTVEFVSDIPCSMPDGQQTNSCGLVPTCFPAEEEFKALIKAAIVNGNIVNIFSGITDAAGNSLDGNKDGNSTSRPVDEADQFVDTHVRNEEEGEVANDNYRWDFRTSAELDVVEPFIVAPLTPVQGDEAVPRNFRLQAIFSEYIRSSTLNSDTFRVFKSSCDIERADFPDYDMEPECYPNFSVYKQNYYNDNTINNGNKATQAIIRTYRPYLDPLTNYNVRLTAEIQDLYQNCFNPASGPCGDGQVTPECP